MLKIQLNPIKFLGLKDEANFFSWLESITGFVKFEGQVQEMYAYFDLSAVTPNAFLEIIRLFLRYRIDRKRLIAMLDILPDEVKQNYLDEKTEWHRILFKRMR